MGDPAVGAADGRGALPSPCPRCQGSQFSFSSVSALWSYEGAVRQAIVAAKYAHRADLQDVMGRRLAARVAVTLADDFPDWATFVPSHLSRQLVRGGSSNRMLARVTASNLGIPCWGVLRAGRRIRKQAWLSDSQRQENVRGAFVVKKGYAWAACRRWKKKHVLLVDDVLTTGATASEVAACLLQAGVRRVSLAVVARAIREGS